MKIDAISSHEASHIIRLVNLKLKWEGTRLGFPIEIVWLKNKAMSRIHYSVRVSPHRVLSGPAVTVRAAIDEVNQIIRGRAPQSVAGRASEPQSTGLPYLVRARHRNAAGGSGELF